MKKNLIIVLAPILLLVAGCSFTKSNNTKSVTDVPTIQNSVCEIPAATTTSETNSKNGLPPVSQEEKNKTFTYEDSELGVKMKYPGSCYFNKGIFQCSDFTLSVWMSEDDIKASNVPEKAYADGQTQIRYVYNHNNATYILMAWYDGEDQPDLDKVIDNMAKNLTFSR